MKYIRKQKLCRILAFIVTAGVLFIIFQFLSIRWLQNDSVNDMNFHKKHPKDLSIKKSKISKISNNSLTKHIDANEDCEGLQCDKKKLKPSGTLKKYANRTLKIPIHIDNSNGINILNLGLDSANNMAFDWDKLINDPGIRHVDSMLDLQSDINPKDIPRGVLTRLAHLYQPDLNDFFRCLHTKELIPFSQVNDDYCDCTDFTDEPGTNACPDSRFFCGFQIQAGKASWLPGNRVNDGICDCCDGSDEWEQVSMTILWPARSNQLGIHHSPCVDRCDELRMQQRTYEKMRQKALKLKEDYLLAAANVHDKGQYGPGGVFYKMSKTCLTTKYDKYEYTACLFVSVKQQAFPQPSTQIGKRPHWVSQGGETGYVLEMGAGDTSGCPGGQSRRSLITLTCGLKEEILYVHEDERCSYGFTISTPAAC